MSTPKFPPLPFDISTHMGAVAVGKITDQISGRAGYNAKLPQNYTFLAPLAGVSTYYINAHAADGSVVTVNKSPDFIRNVRIVASGAATLTVIVKGLDANGFPISETLTLNGATIVQGKKAFSWITTITLPTIGATTISVGLGIQFGFSYRVTENTVFLALVDNVPDTGLGTTVLGATTAGVDYYGTWTPATAPNGTHNYSMYLIPTSLTQAGVNN